ncbi:amidohydrolase [Anaerococcus hydrogenalis]|uniref:5-methylthioadenosine/S-adenosylhomocysteine deaminase n=1 Tax=Anaerococcus hydrogenalis TaxID=33029 RepID=A0A2N6ULP3_9FIRM|nr:amidohydrolase [Anaerococcus hydrogenalis]MDK7694582.1 amidohydrolase [Anaerococcus hydrogenalis]MDK7696360.1 amidohydrolase [Anaerococcus hydrogenalis]MDK7707609.1 amidohydrolase [Anaerococcus hydrogenalis]PMC82716.1 N-ethylammeline chlorohydrolase [Anaerococcus hydrogenalis]
MNILIENVKILTMADGEVIKNGNIYIEDRKIKKISKEKIGFSYDKKIDGENFLAMPGFINAHTHVGMSLFRNYSDDVELMDWLNNKIWPLEDKLTEKDVYWASLLSQAEMIMTGTTTFADMYYYEDQTIEALEKSKMRAQISRGLTLEDENFSKIRENIDLYKKYENSQDGRINIALGPHAVYTTDKNYLKEISKVSKKYNIPIHIHLSETKIENDDCIKRFGQSPTEVFEECGIFENKTIAAHGVHLSDRDLEILSKYDVSVVHNPSSNLKLSSGFLDCTRVINKGINLAIGTDSSASNNNLSMLKEISIASLVSKYKDPKNLRAYDVLKMATINGAKALGIDKETGSLEEGKLADIILIDLNNPNHTPQNNLISSLSYSTFDTDVSYVIINGELVYDNKKFVNLDIEEIMKNSKLAFDSLRKRK